MPGPDSSTFRVLDFAPPESLAIEAGRLFDRTLVQDPSHLSTNKTALECIERFDPKTDSLYAITTPTPELLAAAKVVNTTRDDMSEVVLFAVSPDCREQGYGRMLMGHIGSQVIGHGHDRLKLHTLIPAYFSKLGFHAIGAMETNAGKIYTMVASTDTVI